MIFGVTKVTVLIADHLNDLLKIVMWEIAECLEEDLDHHTEVVVGRVGLQVHVVLQSLDVLGVVSLNALNHGPDLRLHAFHYDDYVNVLLCNTEGC